MKLLEILDMMDIKEHQQVWSVRFLIRKQSVNEQLPEDLYKPVIKKFKEKKVYAKFKDNIWVGIQLKWDHCLKS